MIITTTPSVEGKEIEAYLDIVFGEVISGVNFLKDFKAGLSNFFGGRSSSYEDELNSCQTTSHSGNETACSCIRSQCNSGRRYRL